MTVKGFAVIFVTLATILCAYAFPAEEQIRRINSGPNPAGVGPNPAAQPVNQESLKAENSYGYGYLYPYGYSSYYYPRYYSYGYGYPYYSYYGNYGNYWGWPYYR